MVGWTPFANIHSTMADEQGAQQACNSTLPASSSISPSGTMIAGRFLIIYNYTFIKPPIGFSSAKIQIINQLQDNLPIYLVVCEIIRTFAVTNVYNC
jgi:hypothetical protein